MSNDCIRVYRQFDSARVVLSGDFDIIESNQLIELSTQLFTELTATVEVDMSAVTFFGSRAIAGLLHLRNEVDRHSGAELRISRCSERAMRVLELSGLLNMFAFGPSRTVAELSYVA
jgi:anti-anti-sigma factor